MLPSTPVSLAMWGKSSVGNAPAKLKIHQKQLGKHAGVSQATWTSCVPKAGIAAGCEGENLT